MESLNCTHCVIGWWGEDTKQAGDTASDAGQHPLTLLQRSTLQLSRRIRTHSQQPVLCGGQDEVPTLKGQRNVRIKDRSQTTGLFQLDTQS